MMPTAIPVPGAAAARASSAACSESAARSGATNASMPAPWRPGGGRPARARRSTLEMARDVNASGIPLERVYDEVEGKAHELGEPGAFPYGRGVRADMYGDACGRCVSMRASARLRNPTHATVI